MLYEILMAIVQATTEFLPVSSSGHLALLGSILSEPNLFLITVLHTASLFAILIFTRKEIFDLLSFKKETRSLWIWLIVATLPAFAVGVLFKSHIETALSNLLFLGIAFVFTGIILLSTRSFSGNKKLNWKNSLGIGLMQALALFPGVSRSGMAISGGLFSKLPKEKAIKFSFLLFIPLAVGAMISESGAFDFNYSLLVAFLVCFILSWIFLNFLYGIVKKGYFWVFGFYCFIVGIISLLLYLLL